MAILLSCLLSLFVITPQSSTRFSHTGIQRLAEDAGSTFSVQNETSVNIGWVQIHLSDGSYAYIDVTGSGTFETTIAATAYECALHGQSFAQNNPTQIVVDLHTSVRLTWTGNVIVVDNAENW
jgi:hypothetical protein